VAGSGSEVTGFATVYVDGVKHSLDHPSVHADLAVVDPALTDTCPPDVTFSGALDALAHAVESLWSLRSTARSRRLAADALAALVGALRTPGWPPSPAAREALSAAATRAGLAIDRTRTTGGHAFAYPLTARFGVRHGLACALNLVWLLPFTIERLSRDGQDPRGPAFVGRRLDEIGAALGGGLAELVAGVGFSPWLADHGVKEADLPGLVEAALGSGRATNGPVRLDPAAVLPYLRARLGPAG
jgi:alcohol dehydrogenase class IV